MTNLALLDTQRAPMTVALDDGAGHVTDLGVAFHWTLDNPIISIPVVGGVIYATALTEGTATLHVTTMDGTVAIDIPVTVQHDTEAPPEPGEPTLIVIFGAPIPK